MSDLKQPTSITSFQGGGIQQTGGNITAENIYIRGSSTSAEEQLLSDLRISNPEDDKERIEHTKGGLLRDAYEWILDHETYRKWRDEDDCKLFWIKGDPGKGKTMLLCGIIDELAALSATGSTDGVPIVSHFFCEAKNTSDRNNVTAILRGLVYHLVTLRRSLLCHILPLYNPAAGNENVFAEQNAPWLLKRMLRAILLSDDLPRTYLIVDALDECSSQADFLLDMIDELPPRSHVKFLVSSRKLEDIEEKLHDLPSQLGLEVEDNAEFVAVGVKRFIDIRFSKLARDKKIDAEEQRVLKHMLEQKAGRTFLWISLALAHLRRVSRFDMQKTLETMPPGLPALYEQIIERIAAEPKWVMKECRDLLSAVVLAYRPLHYEELLAMTSRGSQLSDELENKVEYISSRANQSGSLFTVEKGFVYLIHHSVKEFLDSHNFLFPNGHQSRHADMVSQGLASMKGVLRFNMYNLPSPATDIRSYQKPSPDPLKSISYICLYWIDHVMGSGDEPFGRSLSLCEDNGEIHNFLKVHLLHWLEALYLEQKVSSGILRLWNLADLLNSQLCSVVRHLLQDAFKFVRYFNEGFQNTPLQIYSSGLLFSPEKSVIRRLFSETELRGVSTVFKGPESQNWPSNSLKVPMKSEKAIWLTFSHDSNYFASADTERLCIWDSTTGQFMSTVSHDQGSYTRCGAFSVDRKHLKILSNYCEVSVWDLSDDLSTVQYQKTLDVAPDEDLDNASTPWWGLGEQPTAMSPAGTHVATGMRDGRVAVWDLATEQKRLTTQPGHGSVDALSFSAEGSRYIAGFISGIISVYNLETFQVEQSIQLPHGRFLLWTQQWPHTHLATAGEVTAVLTDKGPYFWTSERGQWTPCRSGHDNDRYEWMRLSPEGQQLVFGTSSRIGLFNLGSGLEVKAFNMIFMSCAAAFSNDGKWLVGSSSGSDYMYIWDRHTLGIEVESSDNEMSYMEDGLFDTTSAKWAITRESDNICVLWHNEMSYMEDVLFDTTSAEWAITRESDNRCIFWRNSMDGLCDPDIMDCLQNSAVKFFTASPSGRRVAFSTFSEETMTRSLQCWCFDTGACQQTIQAGRKASKLLFSPDNLSVLVFPGSDSIRFRIWNTERNSLEYVPLMHHAWLECAAAWSPDGLSIAFAGKDDCIDIRDMSAWELRLHLRGHTRRVREISFTSYDDTKVLISTSDDKTVKVWNLSDGSCQKTIDIPDSLTGMSFSFDGTNLRFIRQGHWPRDIFLVKDKLSMARFKGFGISHDWQWITLKGEKYFWIPSKHQSLEFSTMGSMVALGPTVVLEFSKQAFMVSTAKIPSAVWRDGFRTRGWSKWQRYLVDIEISSSRRQ